MNSRLQGLIALALYWLINSTFIIKYGVRWGIPFTIFALIIYPALVCSYPLLQKPFSSFFLRHGEERRRIFSRSIFIIMAGFLFFFSLLMLRLIPAESLNVDRWSALAHFWDAALRGDYPYAALTHLGHNPSPLPVLQLLIFPLYLLGDVGLFQPAWILLCGILLWRSPVSLQVKNQILFFCCLSPALLWELSVRSDFFGNLLLGGLVLYGLSLKAAEKRTGRELLLCALAAGALLSTRAALIIPLLLFAPLIAGQKRLHTFLFIAALSFAATFLPFVLPNPEQFLLYNPLLLNGNNAPFALEIAAVAAALGLGLLPLSRSSRLYAAVLLFTVLLAVSFAVGVRIFGLRDTIYEAGYFQVQYLTTLLPFLGLWLYARAAETVQEENDLKMHQPLNHDLHEI